MSAPTSWRAMEARGRVLGAAAAAARREAIVRTVQEDAPGVKALVQGEDVVLEGRGLMRRWMADLALRMAAGGGR